MNLELNTDANQFITEVERFSKNPLHRKAEMIVIYDAAIDSNQVAIYRELCFTAKYLLGLIRVLRNGGNNPQVSNFDHVRKDFTANITKSIEQIRQILTDSADSQKKYFEEEFFSKTQSGLTNLNELLADLEQVKLYFNYLKRER